jgi:hypothetical protein
VLQQVPGYAPLLCRDAHGQVEWIVNYLILTMPGTLVYLNPDAIVPTYYPQPSSSVLISDITSVYMPGTLLQTSPVSLSSGSPAVQSMGPKAKAKANCEQGAAASFDAHCAVR